MPPDAPSSALTRDDVTKVAVLARLRVEGDALERYTEQLAAILDHASDMAELDLEGVPPTSHPLPLVNVLRPDVVAPQVDRDAVLASAPATEDHRFKVPAILGDEP